MACPDVVVFSEHRTLIESRAVRFEHYAHRMGTEIVCSNCGTDEHLRGAPTDDGLIELTCDACQISFTRDPRPSCPKCGGFDMEAMPQVIVEKSRGTQMSIQGVHREFMCRECDADLISAKRDVHLPRRLRGSQ